MHLRRMAWYNISMVIKPEDIRLRVKQILEIGEGTDRERETERE